MLDADDCLYDRLLDVTAAREWYAIESAACLAHEGEERRAETCRAVAGYATSRRWSSTRSSARRS